MSGSGSIPCKSYISDPPFLLGDEESMETPSSRLKKKSVQLRAAAVKSIENYRTQQAELLVTLRYIGVGEEVFARYGMNYSFQMISIRCIYINGTK